MPKTVKVPEINLTLDLDKLQEINQSGEGTIYKIDDSWVIKIFLDPEGEQREKIRIMEKSFSQDNSPWSGLKSIATIPEYLARNENGKIVGYLMKNLQGWMEINNLYDEDFCKESNISIKIILWIFGLLHEALEKIHKNGYAVGDLNGSNILVSPFKTDLNVRIVDTDSWTINRPDLGINFCPLVQDPEVTHPDHLKAQQNGKPIPPFLPKHDWWTFTYLMAKCLTKRDPFEEGNFWNLESEERRQSGKTTMHAGIVMNRDAAIRHLQIGIVLKHFMKRWLSCTKEGIFPINLLKANYAEMSYCPSCKIEVNKRLTLCPSCAVLL